MPETNSNTSIEGFQRCGRFNESLNPWQLRFNSFPSLSRSQRLGTAVLCLPLSNGRFPVIYSVPVYGGGIAPVFLSGYPNNLVELWVTWYKAGYQWTFERPAVGE